MVHASKPVAQGEPNRRQELALDRIEFALSELATVVLSTCRSQEQAHAAMRDVRKAVLPVLTDILSTD